MEVTSCFDGAISANVHPQMLEDDLVYRKTEFLTNVGPQSIVLTNCRAQCLFKRRVPEVAHAYVRMPMCERALATMSPVPSADPESNTRSSALKKIVALAEFAISFVVTFRLTKTCREASTIETLVKIELHQEFDVII